MIYTIQYRGAYDAIDAAKREVRIPAHDEREAKNIFRQQYPSAEFVRILSVWPRSRIY